MGRCRVVHLVAAASTIAVALMARPVRAAGDAGANRWTPIGPQFSTVLTLAHDPSNAATLLAGTYFGGLYRSTDYGFTWAHVATEFSTFTVFALAYDPSTPGTVYAGTFQQGIYKSTDGGLTWTAANNGLTATDLQAIAVDPSTPLVVIAATVAGIFRSADGARSWTRTDTETPAVQGKTIAFDPRRAGVVYVGTIGHGVLRSGDDGNTWSSFSDGMVSTSALSLRFSPTNHALYAATDQGVYKLRDAAASWVDISAGLPPFPTNDVLPHPIVGNLTFAATLTGTYVRADDESATSPWLLWNAIPSRALAGDPSGSVFHFASVHGGLEATTDFGAHWYQANWGIQNLFVGALRVVNTPGGPLLYAGSDSAVFRGNTVGWQTTFEEKQAIFDIQPHPTDSNVVFIGTERGGVWKSSDAGLTWTTAATDIVPSQVYGIAQAADGSALYAATTSGLYVRATGSDTWLLANTGGESLFLSVVADPVRSPILFVGGHEGLVLRTSDGGYSYTFAGAGLPRQNVSALVAAPWEKVYAVMSTGELFATSDSGLNWFQVNGGIPNAAVSLAVDPAQPWILYMGTSGGGVYKSASAAEDWAPANNGLTAPFVFALAVDPVVTSTVYAATNDGVFRSGDSAASWTRIGAGLPGGTVGTLIVDSIDRRRLYASLLDAGIFTSGDSGATWTPINSGLPVSGAMPLVISRGSVTTLVAGTHVHGIFTSSDIGAHWSSSNIGMTLFVRGLAIDPGSPSTMYAGSLGGGVFKSTDGAAHWENRGLSDRNILKLAIDPVHPSTIYAATSRGVSRSRDGAATWEHLGQKAAYVYSLAVDPRDRRRLFVGSAAGALYRSPDGGVTWQQATTLPLFTLYAIAFDAATGTLYASPDHQGVYRSTDDGNTWTKLSGGASPDGALVSALAVDSQHTLYAATVGSGVFRYRNGAWQFASEGLASAQLAHLAVGADDTLYASTFDAGLFRSTNGGVSWTWASHGLTTNRVTAVTPDSTNPSMVYAATPDGVFKSIDRGSNWQHLNAGMDRISIHRVVVDLFVPGTLYAATNGHGVYRSDDGGATWAPASSGLINLLVPSIVQGASAGALYAGTIGAGIERTTDGGRTWSGGTTPQIVDNFLLGFAVNPRDPSVLYAATSGQGVLKSTNGGIDWWPASNGLEGTTLLSLLIDAQHPDILYAGTVGGGVFYTTTGGAAWKPLNDGLFNNVVTSLALNPADSTQLFAGTEGGGVFFNHTTLEPTTCTYSVTPAVITMAATGGNATVTIATGSGCGWKAGAGDEWISFPDGDTKFGPGAMTVSVALSTGDDARSSTMVVAGVPVVVVQSGNSKLYRLTIDRIGGGTGTVTSDWVGINCGTDCNQLFTDHLPVVLSATAAAGSTFVGWEGDADCADGTLTMAADRLCIARFEPNGDFDGDGLPDLWEAKFGLDPASAAGDDGPDGDPDHDGVSNKDELARGTHPRGFFVRYFADGAEGDNLHTSIALFDPGAAPAHMLVTLVADDGSSRSSYVSLASRGRRTLAAADVFSGTGGFSIVVESDEPFVADRTMTWGAPYSSTGDNGVSAASTRWYFPDGSTAGDFTTRYSVYNPQSTAASVTITYLRPSAPPVVVAHAVPAGRRLTIDVNSDAAELAAAEVSAVAIADVPVVMEQTIALGGTKAAFAEAAAPMPDFIWYLADGVTGATLGTRIVILNPTGAAANVTITYLLPAGGVVQRPHHLDAFTRTAIWVHDEDPLLEQTTFSAIVASDNGVPFVVDRSVWWPGAAAADWYEAGGSLGSPLTGTVWGVASGMVGGADNSETDVVITNVTSGAGAARVTLAFDDGTTPSQTFAVDAFSRTDVSIAVQFPSAAWRPFSVLVESQPAGGVDAAQMVVERTVHSSPAGTAWASGHHEVADRLAP